MASVELNEQKWGQVMFVLANAEGKGITWALTNPLLMEIGNQLREQTLAQTNPIASNPPVTTERAWAADGNSKEVGRE